MNKLLKSIINKYDGCKKCPLHKSKHEYVWFRGSMPCDVLFIGEAPGKSEDLYGEPFIGRAGKILDNWIEDSAIELDRWYPFGVCNVLACIPTQDGKIRQPSKEEASACRPRLTDTIRLANPRIIIILGQVAKKYHKIPLNLADRPVVELQHPAYVLRQGGLDSYAYDSNLLKLTEALELLYAEETIKPQQERQVRSAQKTGSKDKQGRQKSNKGRGVSSRASKKTS